MINYDEEIEKRNHPENFNNSIEEEEEMAYDDDGGRSDMNYEEIAEKYF